MSEWTEVRLGDVVTLQRGFDLPARDRVDGPFPIVSSSGITGFHHHFKVNPPGVVIGRYGSLGLVHWIERRFWPLNTSLWVKDFKGNDPRFVSYLLRTLRVDGSAASAVPGVNRNHLHLLPVLRPSLRTQRRVARLLAAFDELIEINERRVDLLQTLARGVYREWCVRFRFPGHEAMELAGSDERLVPRGWQIAALGDLADVNRSVLKIGELPDPILYLDIASIGDGRIGNPTRLSVGEAPSRARRAVRDGDVVWSTVRPNRRAHGVVHDPPRNLVASTGLAVLTPHAIPSSLLFLSCSTSAFTEYLVSRATGSAYPAVLPKDFEAARMILPPDSVVKAFDDAVEPILRLTTALARQSERLGSARDLLLPRLVSGQLDLSRVDLGELNPVDEE